MNLGPPSGRFPIGILFVLFGWLVSIYMLFNAGLIAGYLRNAMVGTFLVMMLYVLVGNWFASKKLLGQVAFLGLGLVFVIFADTILNLFNIRLSLVPLAFGGVAVTYQGADITWPVLIIIGLFLVWRWREGDFKNLLGN